ncbi:MAG: hypothetical protein C0506_11085 [Anaerolinea sp.]|nr:hypothetical protein [Anaerolinea sp.]
MDGTKGQRASENLRPWEPRRDAIIAEAGFDPYRETSHLPDPTSCPVCGALYANGRWQWRTGEAAAKESPHAEVCPACRRIRDGYPAGYLTLSGQFLTRHRDDVMALVRQEARVETAEHPLNRIMEVRDQGADISITTTDVHLPRRMAEAVHDAFGGELRVGYADEDNLVRVSWSRADVPEAPETEAAPRPPIEIQRNNVIVDPEAESYLAERLAHLPTFYPAILSTRVVLDAPLGHHRSGGPFSVNLFVDVPGTVVAVTRQRAEDLHVAIKEAFDAAQRQLEDYAREQRGEVSPLEAQPRGRVVRLFPDRGYGFLAAEDGHELYFHRNSVLEDSFPRLEVGMEVRYAEELGEKGPQASTVALPG